MKVRAMSYGPNGVVAGQVTFEAETLRGAVGHPALNRLPTASTNKAGQPAKLIGIKRV